MATKQNDWLATLYYNPDLDLADLKKLDITPDNTEFKTASEYKNMPQVAELFTNEEGQFDNKKFDAFYRGAAQLYNNYANNEYVEKLPELLGYLNSQWDAPVDSRIVDTSPHFVTHDDENEFAFGLSEVGRPGVSPWANKTPTEIAESQEVVDYVTGEGLGWTPEDKGGVFKGLTRPTIVLATWDEDGVETINGLDIPHKAGDLKYRNGKPYFETLGDRNPSKKQVLAWTNTFTKESSKWNKYDFFDSDDYEKSFVGTVAKTAFTIAPYFVPYLNYVWAAITATEALGRVTPIIGKAINGIWTGDPNNDFSKTMNVLQGAMMRFDNPVTEESKEKLFTFENFGNLVAMIGGQLTQQQAIAAIPMLLNGMKGTEKTAKLGQSMALTYMALTSAQDSYDTFKDAGASDRVAGWAFLGNVLALRGLMGIDYFRDNVFKHTYMDESTVRVPLFSASKKISAELLAEGEAVKTAQEAQRFIGKAQKFYHEKLLNSAKTGLYQRMLSEGTEEVMEETVLDLSKLGAKLVESFGGKMTENQDKLDFKTDLKDIATRYGMAFFGGLLGGAMFAGQQKYWKWLGNSSDVSDLDDDFKKLTYYIADGKADEMRSWLDNWHRKGLLGSKTLSSKLSSIENIDGVTPIMETVSRDNNLSQNDAVYQGMMKFIDTIETIVNAEGLNITPENILNIKKLGFTPSKELLNADLLVDSMEYSNLKEDYLQLAKDIVTTNLALKQAILDATVKEDTPEAKAKTDENISNSVTIKELQQRLAELRQKRDDFNAGKYNWQYALQSMFALSDPINSRYDIKSLQEFARLYQKDYETLNDEEKTLIEQDYKNFQKKQGKYNVLKAAEVYRQLAVELAPVFATLQETLKDTQVDTKHTLGNYGQTTYTDVYNKRKEITQQLKALRLKEELTEDDEKAIENLEKELVDNTSKLVRMVSNPSSMLIASQNGELYKLGDILQKPILNEEDWTAIYEGVKSIYDTYSTNKMVMDNDTELDAFYNRIKHDFNVLPTIQRITTYMQGKYATMPVTPEDDPEVPVSVQNLSDSTTKDGNTWFAYYADEETPFQRHIADLIDQFVNAVGYDNTNAERIYQQIKQEFKDNTNVEESDVDEMLKVVLPTIAGKSLYEVMQEFDSIRQNINYTPLADILDKFFFQYTGRKTNLLQYIKEEEKRLATSENLTEYLIYDQQTHDDLEAMNKIINAVGAVILGASNKMNASINGFKDNPEPLAILDEHSSEILRHSFDNLSNRIKYLLDLADSNKDRQLKAHEDIDKNMRSKFLKAFISPVFASMFADTFKYTDLNGVEHKINPNEIWQEVAPSTLVWDTIATIDEATLRKAEADFAQRMYEEMSKLSYFEDDVKMAEKLVPLFGKNVSFMQTTILGKDGSEVISQYSLLNYILSMLGMSAAKFNAKYKLAISQDTFDFAPVYGQEFAVRNLVSFMARSGLYNAIIDEMTKRENIQLDDTLDDSIKNHIYDRAKLYNMYLILGSAGSGKSSAVTGTLSTMLKDHKSHQFITMSKTKKLAQNLANNIAEDSVQFYSFDEFVDKVFGRELGGYKVNANNGHFYLENPIGSSKNALFDENKELKVFVIDEISLFTEEELNLISKWAKSRGILVIGLGDPLQNAAKVKITYTDSNGNQFNKQENSGLEDAVYMGAPMLTATFRSGNLAQQDNMSTLYQRLYNVYVQSTQHGAWDAGNYDNALGNEELPITFYEDTKVLLGTKIVDSIDLIEEARKKKGSSTVAIIYDEASKSKYESLDESGITLVPYNEMQGREFDYVFIDVDWEKNSRLSPTYVSKYNMLRDFYTVTQRSTTGSLVIDHGIKKHAGIKQDGSDSSKNKLFELDKSQKDSFKEGRLRAMEEVKEEEGFDDSFKAPEAAIKSTTKKVVAPTTSSAPASTPAVAPISTVPPSTTPSTPAITPSAGVSTPPVEPAPAVTKKVITPSEVQPIVIPERTDAIADNQIWVTWFNAPDGFEAFEKKNGHSLLNAAKKLGFDLESIKDFNYKDLIDLLSSHLRTGQKLSDTISGDLMPLLLNTDTATFRKISNYLRNTPEYRINPINGGQSILTARFYDGEDYITIPITIVNTVKSGIYKGTIRKITKAEKDINGDLITWDEFLRLNPGFFVSDGSILSVSAEKADDIRLSTEYLDSTKEMILDRGNIGKLGYVITDEASIARRRFGDVFNDADGFILKPYSDVALVFGQSRLPLTNMLNFVMAMAGVKDPNKGGALQLSNYYNEPLYTEPKSTLAGVLGINYDAIPAKGIERYNFIYNYCQILDNKSLSRFMQATLKLAQSNSKASQIFTNLGEFLNIDRGINKRKIREKTAIWLYADDKSYILEKPLGSSEIQVSTYNPDTGELIPIRIDTGSIDTIIRSYFGDIIPEMQLMEHLYYTDTGKDKVQVLESNDQIYFAYKGIDFDTNINSIFSSLDVNGNIPFKNGIYIQIKGAKSSTDNDSVWLPAIVNNRTIYIDVNKARYSQYVIDESKIEPFEEEKPPKSSKEIMIDSTISKVEEFLTKNHKLLRKILSNGTARSLSDVIDNLKEYNTTELNNEQDVLDLINLELAENPSTWKIHKLTWINGEIIDNLSDDFNSFILNKVEDSPLSIVTPETFDSWNFGIYTIDNGTNITYKVISSSEGLIWTTVELKTPEDFMALLQIANTDPTGLIKPYVYSLVTSYNPALNAIAEKASDYLYDNIANPDIFALYEQINDYLQKRLENGEC